MKKSKTPTFQLELQLMVNTGQARRLHAHFEAARALYNALLCEALKRLHRLRTDSAWQAAHGLDSLENKRNNTGLRFVLQPPDEGNRGWLVWGKDHIPSLIDRTEPAASRWV
jgi:hypothetical protein